MGYLTDKILPCKKCGDDGKEYMDSRGKYIICCRCDIYTKGTFTDSYQAINEWNRMQGATNE